MKIAIVGVTGFRNRGVEALIQPIVAHFGAKIDDFSITIATWSPEYDRKRIEDHRVLFVKDHYLDCGTWLPYSQKRSKNIIERLKKKALKLINSSYDSDSICIQKMPFDKVDILIVSGGDLFSSDYGVESLRHFIEPLRWAKKNGVPTALIGHSIGRFKTKEQIDLWREAEFLANVITLREPLSYDYLVNELKLDPTRYTVTADTAFLLEPDFSAIPALTTTVGVPTVALSISASISKFTDSDAVLHASAWLSLIQLILDKWGANVAIIPHVHESFGDDRSSATAIVRNLAFDPRIKIFAEDLSAAEYKGIISKCDMVIAERMHAAIAGLSTGVPTVPIGYSIKAQGILTSVLAGTTLQPDDLGMPLAEFLDVKVSQKKLTNIWLNRTNVRSVIGSTVSLSVDRAKINISAIEKLLN